MDPFKEYELCIERERKKVNQIIYENSCFEKKPLEQLYVYRVHRVREVTCRACWRLYFEADRLTPRVLPLSEVIANGTNDDRNEKDYRFTVDPTHYGCRAILLQLDNGWGFRVGTDELQFYNHRFVWHRDKPIIKGDW